MEKVVIIGGGYAGTDLAKSLDGVASVTLIDPKDSFVHVPAAIRSLVEPQLLDDLIIPYGNFLKNGRIVKGMAEKIETDHVVLEDGQKIEGDIFIVATGSSYAAPFKPTDDGLEPFKAKQANVAEQLREAKSVAIVGAGPVGSEMAGEIAYAYPEKNVHLVSMEDSLFPQYKPSLGSRLITELETLGVKLHLGRTAVDLKSLTEPYSGTLTFDNGQNLEADLVMPVIGSRPKVELLQSLTDVKFGKDGRALHDGWLRPSPSRPNLFALGDIIASGDAMTIVSIMRQAPWLSNALKNVLKGQSIEQFKKYTSWPIAPILLPLGPKAGASLLPMGKAGTVVGSFLTRRLKGKDLFVPKYRKFFGL